MTAIDTNVAKLWKYRILQLLRLWETEAFDDAGHNEIVTSLAMTNCAIQ